ncbi:MAG: YaaC family protein, partial [Bacilli bacterium]
MLNPRHKDERTEAMSQPTKYINSENPYSKMWDTFVYFESEATTKSFLHKHYEMVCDDAKHRAYDNATKFIYFIKQAREYYNTAVKSHVLVKPLLLYYGMMSLLKAVVIKYDPFYPNNTGVLRHGMTTRKLKKTNYVFHEDEVKIQKEGLLPHFASLIHSPVLRSQPKYRIQHLISLLPEIKDSYERLYEKKIILPVTVGQHQPGFLKIVMSESVLDHFHFTLSGFLQFLNRGNDLQPFQAINETHSKTIEFSVSPDHMMKHPRFIQDYKGEQFFLTHSEELLNIPESCIHYIIMYQLGMLCRYETELWGELIY